ncbi:MAG: DUF342 domain-containing protein [Candidatus Omnitrophica bacterium]|nr:DUF342 domain-containing protein [Candidatus Omnitrophota bacterium]
MQENGVNWNNIISILRKGLGETADAIEKKTEERNFAKKLHQNTAFLDQMEEWIEKLPLDRIRRSFFSFIKKLDGEILNEVRRQKFSPTVYGATTEHPSAPFIEDVILQIGPEIIVSPNKMAVHIVIDREFAHTWDAPKIVNGLQRMGIQGDILEKGIEQALKNPGKPFKTAVGRCPEAGQDAVIEDCLGLDLTGIPTIVNKHRVDLKSLNWVHNVAQNQVIMKKIPVIPGIPGMDVYGEEIPYKEGIDASFPPIDMTAVSEDGMSLLSLVDGCILREGDSFKIVPTLDIHSNVDYSTGHVSAEVTVNVQGDVLSDFKVNSNQDIHVKGTVEGCHLTAKGSLLLPGGVQGKSEAVLISGKHINARFINAAKIIAAGEVTVHGSIIQSYIRARRVEALNKDAEILGGIIESVEDVCADVIGSELGVRTLIRLGYDIPELNDKIEHIQNQIDQLEEKDRFNQENLDKLNRLQKQSVSLSASQEKLKAKLIKNQKKILDLMDVKRRQLELAEEAHQKALEMKRTVRARKNILPGVSISILDHTFSPQTPTGPATFFVTAAGIEQISFEDRTFTGDEEVDE